MTRHSEAQGGYKISVLNAHSQNQYFQRRIFEGFLPAPMIRDDSRHFDMGRFMMQGQSVGLETGVKAVCKSMIKSCFRVIEAILLSPGLHSEELADKFVKERNARRKQQNTTQYLYKRKKMQLQKHRKEKQRVSDVKEGKTYEANMAIFNNDVIPDTLGYTGNEAFITFDSETTRVARNSDIIQTVEAAGDRIFQNFIFPRCEISKEASQVTFDKNTLYLNGKIVETIVIQEELLTFLEFMQSFKNPIFVGHNCKSFDNLFSAIGYLSSVSLLHFVSPLRDSLIPYI